MTRLKSSWVSPMLNGMDEYNSKLKEKTGCNLLELARDVCHADDEKITKMQKDILAGVIPITQGEGIIGNFSEAVASIIASMGFRTIVTEHTDVDGIYEACQKGCKVLFFADDDRYLALNIGALRYADNNYCTALGYINALEKLMQVRGKTITGEKLLVIGYGIVGKEAVKILQERNISFCVYDKNSDVLEGVNFETVNDKDEIKSYRYILDFTNEGGWLTNGQLCEDVIYASPGVPCSLDEKTQKTIAKNAVYDNLEIGTAIMLGKAIF